MDGEPRRYVPPHVRGGGAPAAPPGPDYGGMGGGAGYGAPVGGFVDSRGMGGGYGECKSINCNDFRDAACSGWVFQL